ncbi:MAG: AMP-binding protein, partial [Nitrospirae bacterium]|nr:AMP-binding protein [Nitrospirota bacterium]
MSTYVIHRIFFDTADKYKDKVVFNYFNQTWKEITYKQFSQISMSIACYLLEKGVKKEDKVAIISENRPEWCTAYLAISLSGAIAVPID